MSRREVSKEPSAPTWAALLVTKPGNITSQLENTKGAPVLTSHARATASSPPDNARGVLWLPAKPCLQDATLIRAWAT